MIGTTAKAANLCVADVLMGKEKLVDALPSLIGLQWGCKPRSVSGLALTYSHSTRYYLRVLDLGASTCSYLAGFNMWYELLLSRRCFGQKRKPPSTPTNNSSTEPTWRGLEEEKEHQAPSPRVQCNLPVPCWEGRSVIAI